MAVKSKEALKTQSAETFYDNDLGGITAADHRQFNEDLIDSMATAAQGNLADTAIQGMQVGESTYLPTIERGGKNILLWPAPPANAAQGAKADTAVQAATIGGAAVTKSGTTLQLPAYPAEVEATAFTKSLISGSTQYVNTLRFGVVGNAFILCGCFKSTVNGSVAGVTISNISASYLNRMELPSHVALPILPKDTTQRPYTAVFKLAKTSSTLSLTLINPANDYMGDSKELIINSLIIPLS